MTVNKIEFKVEKDGKEVILAAVRPNQEVKHQAEMEYAKAWSKYVRDGLILESTLWDHLRKQNIWDNEKQNRLDEIDKRLNENQDKLPDEKGKVKQKGVTLSQAREAAIQMRIDRVQRVNLLREVTRLTSNTCEGMANNDKFNYLVSKCIVTGDTNNPYFLSLKDYLDRANDPTSEKAAQEFATLYYNHDPDFDKNLPENQFLLKYKMCRGDLSLVDKDGNLVDIVGNKVDENGFVIEAPKVDVETFEIEDDWNPKPVEN